ncbi:hypothetical protein [Patiriisocius marinus]|uniref:hypothetical protein n=1 Tax=Patiriisocius marinus TaxID=1397112 RepID=UPI00232B1F69|nr:hypothetical protein [Patiriisocius marinus]
MQKILVALLLSVLFQSCSKSKREYLMKNRFDLNTSTLVFPENDFNIIGFGAYHGSVKTEEAELALITALTKNNAIDYYLPETDFSIAHYFNQFLKTGDTILLKDLVTVAGTRVEQERTIEIYEKWKKLKEVNDKLAIENKLEVIGIDIQVNYKYVSRHILELVNAPENTLKPLEEIRQMVKIDTTSYAFGDLSYAHNILKSFVNHVETNTEIYKNYVENIPAFNHIISNLKISFEYSKQYRDRDRVMYDNYLALDKIYHFKEKPQFLRMGFSHIEKSREGINGYPHFFARLIENEFYKNEKVLSIIGYFMDSEVVWDELYDEQGNYTGYTIKGGFGIGDYEKEYFRGIQNLKDAKISDKTLFRLNNKNSPYSINEPDLIEVIMQDNPSNSEAVKGMSTLQFIDYALLISDSKASTPIFEMD